MTVFENVWLADDDNDDCEIFEEAIRQILPYVSLLIVKDGEELMTQLEHTKPPDILFLDINMPARDGLDCLKEIRSQKRFEKLPIVIFSSSIQPRHVEESYGLGANLYYSKPLTFTNLIAGLGRIFQMNWNDPYTITSAHFIDNKYVPFKPDILN
jgi:CheY-like chemotaxis protein